MSWHTRRLYNLEDEHMQHLPELTFNEARDRLHAVWAKYAPVRWRKHPPKLEYGDGLIEGTTLYSFAEGRERIVLCPLQREAGTLLHEVTHTLRNGDTTHGPRFVGKFFCLLVDEEVTTLEELAVAATRHRLDPRWIYHYDNERKLRA